MPSRPNKHTSKNRLPLLAILLVWFVALAVLYANQQALMDWWRLRNYQAPTAIAQLATQDGMTEYARKVFYVNQPVLEANSAFADKCPNNGGEQTIVLGCYHGNQAGIYLLSVSDARLNGVTPVTAAHEMLHAAYDRLSSKDRANVDAMLLDYYNHDMHDQRLQNTIAAYKKSEPKDVVNEMHSIFGTEVAQLPTGLEEYYKRYFSNRAQIAAYAANYQAEFTQRQTAVAQDDAQLHTLKSQIDAAETDLKERQTNITNQQAALVRQRDSGEISSYNAAIPAYNNQVNAYNAAVQRLQSLINQYNQLVAHRNAIALEENQLVKELSNNVDTINQ